MSKELKEHGYFKEKGVVEKLVSKYIAQIAMLKSGDLLQVNSILSQPVPMALKCNRLCVGRAACPLLQYSDLDMRNACRWTRLS